MKRICICLFALALAECLVFNWFLSAIGEEKKSDNPITYFEWDEKSEGQKAKAIQEMLIKYGYLYGSADGVIGNQSVAAINKYKLINGLSPINPDLTYEMYKSLSEQKYNAMSEPNLSAVTYKFWQYTIEAADERGNLYDAIVYGINEYNSLTKQGKTGTKAFYNLKQELIPEGYDEEYISVLRKYFTSDDTGTWNFAKSIARRDNSVINYYEKGGYIYWEMDDKFGGVNQVCMISELDIGHTMAVLGKMLDSCDEYVSDPWSLSWSVVIKTMVDSAEKN